LGKIKIEEKPFFLFVACSNVVDFSQISNAGQSALAKIKFILERYSPFSTKEVALRMNIPIPGITGNIIAQDFSQKELGDTFAHEEEHALWNLIFKAYSRVNTVAELTNSKEEEKEEDTSRENLLNDSVDNIYNKIENEFLAHLAENHHLKRPRKR
jgi:hypothetical protein